MLHGWPLVLLLCPMLVSKFIKFWIITLRQHIMAHLLETVYSVSVGFGYRHNHSSFDKHSPLVCRKSVILTFKSRTVNTRTKNSIKLLAHHLPSSPPSLAGNNDL